MQTTPIGQPAFIPPPASAATTATPTGAVPDFAATLSAAMVPPAFMFDDCQIDHGLLGVHVVNDAISLGEVAANMDAALPVFAGNFQRACAAYGIPFSPPIQLMNLPNGGVSATAGDPRAAAITQMFAQQPALTHQYDAIVGAADLVGDAQVAEARQMIASRYGEGFATEVVTEWCAAQLVTMNGFGIRFDNGTASVRERVNNGWRPPLTVLQIAQSMMPGVDFGTYGSPLDAAMGATG